MPTNPADLHVPLPRPVPQAVLDRDFVVRRVNAEYCTATGRTGEELVSVPLFDSFPDNPGDPSADGVARMTASFERVLGTGLTDHLAIQRYDVEDRSAPGTFAERWWMPVSRPVLDGDRVVGVAVEVQDLSALDPVVLDGLQRFRDDRDGRGPGAAARDGSGEDRLLTVLTSALDQVRLLTDEIGHLRRAMATRGTIDQARGLVMAARGCGPEEAFEVLRKMSNDTNVRLADVAAALVHRARRPGARAAGEPGGRVAG